MNQPKCIVAVVAAAVVVSLLGAVPASAQSCPSPNNSYLELLSSCYYSSCQGLSNPVTFNVWDYVNYQNYAMRSCDKLTVNFGDGTSASPTSSTFTHTYTKSGSYSVTATLTAPDNSWSKFIYSTYAYVTNGYIFFPTYGVTAKEDAGVAHVDVSTTVSPATVDYSTVNGSATAGTRYTAVSGTLSFAAGETKKTIDIPLINDSVYNGSQYFYLQLSNPTNATLQNFYSSISQTISITDDELPPTLNWAQSSYSFSEAAGTGTLTVNRTGDMTRTVSASYYVRDYYSSNYLANGTLTFAANETSKTITFPIPNDNVWSGDRTDYAELYSPTNGAVIGSSGYYSDTSIKIVEDDPVPTVSIDDITVTEGNSGFKTVNFNVTLSAPLNNYTYVYYTVEAGSARLGIDYSLQTGYLYFPYGETKQTIPVTIYGDTEVEPNESFTILLSSTCCTTGVPLIAKARGICTIVNDDAGIGPSNLSIAKGSKGNLYVFLGAPQSSSDTIAVTSSNTVVATVPSSVPLPSSTTSAAIEVTGVAIGGSQITAKLPASLGGTTLTANVQVYQPATLTFQPDAIGIPLGASRSVTVTLSPPPSNGSVDLGVKTTNASVVDLPATVTIGSTGTGTLVVKGKAKGSALVGVTMPAANGGGDQFFQVQVTDPPTGPFLTQVAPPIGPAAGGTNVTITGQNLSNGCTLSFGGSQAVNTAFVSATSMTATTPTHAAGTVDVVATCGADTFTLPGAFTFTASPASITAISPSFGTTGGGTVVKVTGTNLRSACGVFFDNMVSKLLSASAPDSLTVSLPAHTAGTVDVSVRCGDASSTLKSAFTYTTADEPSPSISDIDPLAGSVGQRVTIKGARFRTSDVVTFGDARATVVSTTPDAHVVEVPPVPLGKIAINLADVTGRLTTTGPIFTILEPATPQITAVTPTKIAPGGEIVITGSGFRSPYTFALDGRKAGSVIDLMFTRATVRVATDMPAGTYTLGVMNGDGQLAAIGPKVDVIPNALVAMTVSPGCARADGGTEVTINGNGFSTDARVLIGGAAATNIRVIDAHTIKAIVPEGAMGWSNVVVTNPNGDATTLTRAFFYYSPYDNSGGCTVSRTHGVRH